MKQFTWKDGIRFTADPQKIGEELGDGSKIPEEVIELARNKKGELHRCFEWQDSKAAHQHRLRQARDVLAGLEVTIVLDRSEEEKESITIRAYAVVAAPDGKKRQYQPISTVIQEEDMRSEVLADIRDDLMILKRKLDKYVYLFNEFEQYGDAIVKIARKMSA